MFNLKKMLSNDPTANDKSNDLIRKTPSSRKLRVPVQGKLTDRKCTVKMANVKTELRVGLTASPPLRIVGVWEYREAKEDVQLDKISKIPEQTSYPGEYFESTEGPTKLTCFFKYFKCTWNFTSLPPFSPLWIGMQLYTKLNLCLSFAVLVIASAFPMSSETSPDRFLLAFCTKVSYCIEAEAVRI